MADLSLDSPPPPRHFATTRWTVVLAAGDTRNPQSREALAALCQTYHPAVYAYVRSRGQPAADAEDLTQSFFARLLEKKVLRAAAPDRGRFRSFLLTAVKNFLANAWDRTTAAKRGGGEAPLSFDFAAAESRFEPAVRTTPEDVFLQHWVLTLLTEVLDALAAEMAARGGERRFEVLRGFLTGPDPERTYRDAGKLLGLGESAVKVAVHRLRQRFGELLRQRVAETVASADEVDDEIAFLMTAAGS